MIVGIQQGFDNTLEKSGLDGLAAVMRGLYHRDGVNYGVQEAWPAYRETLKVDAPDFVSWFETKIVGN